jgi:DNA-binding PadR family transcriptional regulator
VTGLRFGRYAEAAVWILAVLVGGPQPATSLRDEVRRRRGPIGPGTLFGAIARLEQAALIERVWLGVGAPTYRLNGRRTEVG